MSNDNNVSSASDDDEEDHFLSPFASLRNGNSKMNSSQAFSSPGAMSHVRQQQQHDRITRHEFYDDGDVEANSATEVYRQALNDSVDLFVNERSALLGSSKKRKGSPHKGLQDRSIHPLWDTDDDDALTPNQYWWNSHDDRKQLAPYPGSDKSWFLSKWARFVCISSLVHFMCMGLHDAYQWYLGFRLGVDFARCSSWSLPWISPCESTLVQFGAFVPYNVVERGQYWRFVTGSLTCTSLVEWILVFISWQALRMGGGATSKNQRQGRIWFLYCGSVLTGQLFMAAWGNNGIAGGASLGTCGVLCAKSVQKPRQRFVALCMSLFLLILDLIGPYNSLVGGMGATAFGWTCFGALYNYNTEPKKKGRTIVGALQWACGVLMLSLWIMPTMWIAFT